MSADCAGAGEPPATMPLPKPQPMQDTPSRQADAPAAHAESVAPGMRAWIVALTTNLLVAAICVFLLWRAWLAENDDATTQGRNLAQLIALNVSATLDKAGHAVESVAALAGHAAASRSGAAAAWPELVDAELAVVPEVRSIDLHDSEGQPVCGVEVPHCAGRNAAADDDFRRLRDDPRAATVLVGPRPDEHGRPSLRLERALRDRDGAFAGIASASIPLQSFQPLLASVDLGPQGAAALYGGPLTPLLRQPALGAAAAAAAADVALAHAVAARPDAGDFTAVGADDGIARRSAYRRLARYPLLVVVGTATSDYLAAWRRMTVWTGVFYALFAAASVVIVRLVRIGERRRERIQALYDSAPCGYHVLDAQGRYLSVNATELGWLGCGRDEVVGRLGPADFLDADSRAAFEASLSQLRHSGQVDGLELVVGGRDGTLRRVLVNARAVRNRAGQFEMSNSVMHDITAIRQAEEARIARIELEARHQQLQETARLKDAFLANLSHELRTPLNAVLGFAQLLQAAAASPGAADPARYVAGIVASGQHLLRLIESLLDFAQVESGKLEFRPEPVDVGAAIGEAVEMLRARWQQRRLSVETEVAADLGVVVVDPLRLRQALLNYLGNAIKFSHEGGRIAVRAAGVGAHHFRIDVEDQGIGIAVADQPRLFTQFLQLSSGHSRSHEGTGLGLALVRSLVQAQGGTVGVRSSPGVGSVFHLTLPRAPAGRPGADGRAAEPGLALP